MWVNHLKRIVAANLLLPGLAFAGETDLDSASTVWMMLSTLLVLLMFVPGLALFYGGMVRAKNILSIYTQFFAVAGVVCVLWLTVVYSMSADKTHMQAGVTNLYSFVGSLNKAFLVGIDENTLLGGVPEYILIIFGMTFAIITPCLAIGAFAERMKFGAVVLFSALWLVLVYGPMTHMVWGGEGAIMHTWGVLDFAGGTAVHINAGIAALVGAIVLGKRKGWPAAPVPPHNVVYTMIGAAFLWVGWFGFNVGSAFAVNASATIAMMTTMVATCGGILGWMVIEKMHTHHVTALGLASGAIGGLVGITPAAAYVGPFGALAIGFITAICCFYAVTKLKHKMGIDDALDVFALHGIGGMVGCMLTSIFCIPQLGGKVADISLLNQLAAQAGSIVLTVIYCGVLTWLIMKFVDKTIGLRVTPEQEERGLDVSDHNERAYNN